MLLTGVSSWLGSRLARRLEAREEVEYLLALDLLPPREELERTEFLRFDLRSPLVYRILEGARVDTVVHLGLMATPRRAGGREELKERNVIATMQLAAACQRHLPLRKLVMRSTTAVYGSSPRDPALFAEEAAGRGRAGEGYARDALEAEEYVAALGRRRPEVCLTVLRFANFIGASIDSALSLYFSLPVVPTAFGFDPRFQLVHEEDALEVLEKAVLEDHPGVFNVAPEDILYLSKALRILRKIPLPVLPPLASAAASLLGRLGVVDISPEQVAFLLWGRVVDPGKFLREFGRILRYSSEGALRDFAARRAASPAEPRAPAWEEEVRRFLARLSGGSLGRGA